MIARMIERASTLIGAVALMLMMLQIAVDVLLRNLTGSAIPATADLVSKYYMVAVAFVPLALADLHRRHIEATIFTDGLRGAPRRLVEAFGVCLSLAAFGLLGWGATQEALKNTARGSYVDAGLIQVPTWPGYWFLPLGFVLMALVLASRIPAVLRGQHGPSALALAPEEEA
ncbi:MAG: hypothetical protein RLZ26_1836 [Pseudomonadota bacterium]|jgi:TRAP-type C4-dicarboxylate transport system permease small subunit